jgi:hypothetical protein
VGNGRAKKLGRELGRQKKESEVSYISSFRSHRSNRPRSQCLCALESQMAPFLDRGRKTAHAFLCQKISPLSSPHPLLPKEVKAISAPEKTSLRLISHCHRYPPQKHCAEESSVRKRTVKPFQRRAIRQDITLELPSIA